MNEACRAIVEDVRLTPEARVCALHLLSLGEGEHEVSFPRWRSLLSNASRARTRDALALLEEFDLVTRHHGGSRPDRYELTGVNPPVNGLSDGIRPVNQNLTDGKRPVKRDRGAEFDRSNPRARDAPPPDVAPAVPESAREKFEIDPRADEALDDRFTGCRDSIRDALWYRIPPEFHYAFVMSLLAYIQQSQRLTDAKGKTLPPEQIPPLIAKTLNELGPEIDDARNPTRKVTANLQGIARRVNEDRRGPKTTASNGTGSFSQEEYDALAG